jgi:hypothetical protein
MVLRVGFDALFSHALDADITVKDALAWGERATLVPHLNLARECQLPLLLGLIAGTTLSPIADVRKLVCCAKPDESLDSAALYMPLSSPIVYVPY